MAGRERAFSAQPSRKRAEHKRTADGTLAPYCQDMSNSRQLRDGVPHVRAVAVGFSSGYRWRLRGSEWGVLTWASQGVITVAVDRSVWVVPTQQALWIPAGAPHSVRMAGKGVLRQVYFADGATGRLAGGPSVVTVTPLLAALLRRACDLGELSRDAPEQERLIDLLLDELIETPLGPIDLPMPSDTRALIVAEQIHANPQQSPRDVRALSRGCGASVRTLERLFRSETGLSFGAWRQRARLVHAMTKLAEGSSVTQAGIAAGYAGTSAFVAAFRRLTGVTPGRYAKSTQHAE